jgi:hypothetical protein
LELLETDNLPVELTAVRSGLTPDDNHERFAGLARLGEAFIEGRQPSLIGGLTSIFAGQPWPLGQRRG